MLLCPVYDLEPGLVTGASILHPERPDMELLSPGQELTPKIIQRLVQVGVPEVWVHHELTDDLENITGESLTLAQRGIYNDLKSVFSGAGRKTVTAAHAAPPEAAGTRVFQGVSRSRRRTRRASRAR